MTDLPRDPAKRLADRARRMAPGYGGESSAPVDRVRPHGNAVNPKPAKAGHTHDTTHDHAHHTATGDVHGATAAPTADAIVRYGGSAHLSSATIAFPAGTTVLNRDMGDSRYVDTAGDTMTGALHHPAGTQTAPAVTVGVTSLGLFRHASGEAAGALGVSGALRVDSWMVATGIVESRSDVQAPFGDVIAGGGGSGGIVTCDTVSVRAGGLVTSASVDATTVRSHADGTGTVGTSTRRYQEFWATNGIIQTSDVREKADVRLVDPDAAADRVRNVAEHAIHFRWADGQRTHEGFDARAVADVLAGECAAVCDPTVEADRRVNPYIGEATQEWLDEHTPQHARDVDQIEVVHEQLRQRWAERRDAWEADTDAMRDAPVGIRVGELIPDLYAALAAALDRIDRLEQGGTS